MAPSFGTSGLRGLVTELTPELVTRYVQAFLATCPNGGRLYVGRDLRPSSPEIARHVLAAARAVGIEAVDCGDLGTPALALASMGAGAAAIMVTGSHIPADRNGLKFYLPGGEVSKADEARIVAGYAAGAKPSPASEGSLISADGLARAYVARYAAAFGAEALSGMKVGVYQHSSVAREVMMEILAALGARPVALARSEVFVPVDTEAVPPDTRAAIRGWCAELGLDAVVSTDGDADRPLLADAAGEVVPGDVLGVISARALGAKVICTPVSSNAMVGRIPEFAEVRLTKIGSPFVIAAMEAVLAADPAASVAGFEANGGFLLGFTAEGGLLKGPLPPLMTRDSVLPMLAPLAVAKAKGQPVADLVAGLPPCFTAADRVQEIDRDKAKTFLDGLIAEASARVAFFAPSGEIDSIDLTDGLRVNLTSGAVVHLRPSGNAPEFRIYAQGTSPEAAQALTRTYMDRVAAQVR
ncbi:phosphomannomutase [Frigidibacter mobilis]|uniref:Phosphomannomutase n=1 Tax=Frigidibacter mobilis TaxID=1335048 RepID=A0A159Z7Q3_9RHOB|nr:phosphomannomutase [Frigidibacter mobilis]AMY70574.1 phosphomannomutase [Frigidibacter mobilis]